MSHRGDPNKRFYGAITVSDRGQIVIPAQARRDFGIEVGDKLLVFGDLPDAIAFVGMAIIVASGLYVALGHRPAPREEPETAME